MDPINYAGMIQSPDFGQSIQQGLQIGAGFQQLQQRRAELEKAQLAAQRTAQFRNEVGPALQAGDPAALVQLFGKYPDFGDQIKQASGFLNDADENNKKTTSATVYNGLQSGNVDIAKQALESRVNYLTKIGADANEWKGALDALNSGDPDKMKQVQQQATLLHALYNPTAVKAIGEIRKDEREQALQPAALRTAIAGAGKAESDAATAAVTAKHADSKALAELDKAGWDVKKIQADIGIAKESNRIAAMNAAFNREGNVLKRQELGLKLADAKTARDTKIRENVATAEAGAATVDNMLTTVNRILDNKSLDSVVGSLQGRVGAYLNDEAADAIAQIETLGSQVFLSQIPQMKGTGNLTEREGDKLQASLQNLTRAQSEDQFRANLREVQRLGMKARKGIESKYGVPLSSPDVKPRASENGKVPSPSPATPAPARNVTVDY